MSNKILLVEDNKETADLVKMALEYEDMNVDVAFDGQDGLEHFMKGPGADLKELVNMIKSKLEPMDEDTMKTLINGTDIMKAD